MTEIIHRSPLHPLSMSSTQRTTRRRSARNNEDEEDARPTKKAKIDDGLNGNAKQSTRKITTTSKASKAAYDEDAEGFQFSRAKSKKAAPKTLDHDSQHASENTTQKLPGRRKKASLEPVASDDTTVPKRRRSARLSGENDKAKSIAPDLERADANVAIEKPQSPPGAGDEQLHVPKRRVTKIALPFADTPIMVRNKEMRKTSGQNHRRSSSGMRGHRASSMIDSGSSNALPHTEVETSELYKHIAQDLPEPRRMKQLLIWCGARALPPKATGGSEDTSAILAARVIQDELLKDFANKSEMSYWFSREEEPTPTVLVKKPNPRNQQNAMKLQELEQEAKRLEEEKATWEGILASLSKSIDSQPLGTAGNLDEPLPLTSVKPSLLSDSAQASVLGNLTSQADLLTSSSSRLKKITSSIEFTIDSFADGLHRLERFKDMVEEVADQVLESGADVLEKREQHALERTGMEKVNVLDVLKPLSRIAD